MNINMKRPQHITITSIKYLISYPINMKVSNQVFTTSTYIAVPDTTVKLTLS